MALGTAVCAGIASRWLVVGSVEGGWTYPYLQALSWPPLLVATATWLALVALAIAPLRQRLWLWLAVTILVATASHAAIRGLAPFSMQAIFVSPGANSFYTFAGEVSAADLMGKFDRVTRAAPLHAQSNLPGKTLLVHALQAVTSRPDVLPWLLLGVSNLGAICMFGLARELFHDDRAACNAALLYLFTPGRIYFVPIMNAVTPLLVLAFAWAMVRWMRRMALTDSLMAAVLLFVLVLFEPLPLVLGLFFLALAGGAMLRGELAPSTFVVNAAAMIAFFVLTAVVVYEVTGFHLVRAFRTIGAHAVAFNETAGRSYDVWIVANLREFLLSAGPAQVVMALGVPVAVWRCGGVRATLTATPSVAALGLLAVLVVTDLIGINRGEVVRLWIFLACAFQLPAAFATAALGDRGALIALLGVTVLQATLGTAMIGFVLP